MTDTDLKEMMHRLDLQNCEFDALIKLADAFRKLQMTAVVDDDYPEYRHYYESALKTFFDASRKNGRFK